MFKRKTVIIAGAGASAEFELPTGQAVFEQALKLPLEPGKTPKYLVGFSFEKGFADFLNGQDRNELWSKYSDFVDCVNSSAFPSIDRLAWATPEIADVCRAFSAWSIFQNLYVRSRKSFKDYSQLRTRDHYFEAKQHLKPMINGAPNWIAASVNKWIGDAESGSELNSELLTFVTFNYDRLIEEAIKYFVTSAGRFRDVSETSLPRVLHVHGGFPPMPNELNEQFLIDAQSCIRYIEDGGENVAATEARSVISDAEHVICVGFDFDSKNVELIGLQEHSNKIQVLDFDGNEGLMNRVLSLGAKPEQILSGSSADRLGVSRAAARGFLDRAELLAPKPVQAWIGLSQKVRDGLSPPEH